MWEPAVDFLQARGLISRTFIFVLLFLSSFVQFQVQVDARHKDSNFLELKETIAPYLLPANHPVKAKLDKLFASSRAIFNLDTLKEAGFNKSKPRKFTKLIVTKHEKFPGYIFKIYLDAQRPHKDLSEYQYWLLRIEGANKIRQMISDNHLEAVFKVPQKWIYVLPKKHLPAKGYYTKYTILVEEDMDILPNQENKELWASDKVTHEQLDKLFLILKEIGLIDCAKIDNIPFCRDGRIAFIDTQSHGMEVEFENLCYYLSKSNKEYWKSIISY